MTTAHHPAVLLDTHALIWWQVDAERIRLDRPVATWVRDALAQARVEPVTLDAEVASGSVELGRRGFHRDPADRFLWATAARLRLPLVTKDGHIHDYGRTDPAVELIW